ncbi:Bug family tripartite tricarboxylate transporter substrate binding protein [Amorphus sp. 3PC139-8]|uniref:Bug family tripartite tricarboxylate transporter substrate binding protein n=1 Tax=Amorphus sp. 3PC139-8 TaxID=2735676 RepID=UPI00345DD1D0
MRPFIVAAVAAALGFGAAVHPAKAEYPDKPIKLIIPFRAGGGSDGLARAVQAAVDKHDLLPVPLVVVNADGAAGTVGTRQVLNAEPDGYTLLQIHQEMFAVSALGRVEYTPADLQPVIQASESCLFVAVPIESEFQTLEEFLTYAKEHPGEIKQADDIGSSTHFPSAQLMQQADTQWAIVPTGGTSKRFASMKGGFTDMALMSAPWLTKGKNDLRPLAALGSERFDDKPDLATAKEQGYDVEGCLRRRYWAPEGTPPERVAYLADVLTKALQSEEVQTYLDRNSEDLKILVGEELQAAIDADYQSYLDLADLVKQTSTKN